MDFQRIGKQIQFHRKQAGLTQEQLAERVNRSPSYLSHVECGRKKISLTSLAQIAVALEVSMGHLLNEPEHNHPRSLLPEVSTLLSECSAEEQQIIFEVAQTLKRCLQNTSHH